MRFNWMPDDRAADGVGGEHDFRILVVAGVLLLLLSTEGV